MRGDPLTMSSVWLVALLILAVFVILVAVALRVKERRDERMQAGERRRARRERGDR